MFIGDDEWFCSVAINDVPEADMKTLHDLQPNDEQTMDWSFLSFRFLDWVAATISDNADLFSAEFVAAALAVCRRDEVGEILFYMGDREEEEDDV